MKVLLGFVIGCWFSAALIVPWNSGGKHIGAETCTSPGFLIGKKWQCSHDEKAALTKAAQPETGKE